MVVAKILIIIYYNGLILSFFKRFSYEKINKMCFVDVIMYINEIGIFVLIFALFKIFPIHIGSFNGEAVSIIKQYFLIFCLRIHDIPNNCFACLLCLGRFCFLDLHKSNCFFRKKRSLAITQKCK